MRAAFFTLMRQRGWVAPGGCLVAGVSGGIDSMVLLHLLREMSQEAPFQVVAAHLNHSLRGEESERDERFVRETCSDWGIPLEVGREDVRKMARKEGNSIQVAARKVRYAFYAKTLEKRKGDFLALGHHADDVAETMLLRFLRGASVHGLRGIPEQNGKVIRPLLSFSRRQIEAYAREHGIPYVEDSSNLKLTYLRNRIRHRLLPELAQHYQPAISRRLIRYAAYFGEIHTLLMEQCRAVSGEVIGGDGTFDLKTFRRLPRALQRVLLEEHLLQEGKLESPLTFRQLDGLLQLVASSEGTQKLELHRGVWAIREYDHLIFTNSLPSQGIHPVTCPVPGSVFVKEIGNRLIVEETLERPEDIRSTAQEAYVEGDRIGETLWIRGFQPGDRIELQGTTKVKKLFIDAKIPVRRRRLIPLIGSGDEIVWVAGVRVNRRFYVTERSRRLVRMRFQSPIEVR